MTTRTIPPLLADGGDMTIMRHVASHAYGTITVTYPEGIDAPEEDDLNQAYSYQLRNEETPPFGRAFIRADLDIDAENNISTVEEILDDVTGRTAGEALFQRDISRAGLGILELGVDFNVGDLVPVRLWGRILENQLITAADDLSSPGDPFGCRVHVGGQLIREPSSLTKGNRDVARQIAQERKERLAQVKSVDKKASEAKDTADAAQSTAETAQGTAEDAKSVADDALAAATDADGVIQGYITEGRQHVEDALGHADDARGNAETAFGEAERAIGLVDEASLIIDQAQEKLDTIPAIIESGRRWAQLSAAQSASSQVFASQALIHADKADEHAQSALRLVDDALVLVDAADDALDLIEVELDKIPGLIAEGEQHVENAKGHADRAGQAVTDAGAAKAAAETALTNATNLLADIDGEGTDFPTAVTQVLGAHNDVLTKHDEVLTKHGEAITAANNSAREAGAAAQSALDAGTALGLIQIEMIEVDRLQNRAIRAVAGAAAQASMAAMQAAETGRLAAKAAGAAGKAADSAGKAAQDALDASEDLATVQILHGEVLTKHGQAIKAAAGAAAQAAMAAMQATETARSAALAAQSALDAIEAMDEALTAKEAAEAAREEAQAAAMANIDVALKLQENAVKWASILSVRTFSTPNLSSSWTVEDGPWISIYRTPGIGVSLGTTGDLGRSWLGTLTIHYVNQYGQSVIHQHDRTVVEALPDWGLTNEEASGEVRDVTVTVSPWKWGDPRQFVFPYSHGGAGFDSVSTYDDIPYGPTRQSDGSYTFGFAVRADRQVSLSPDDGVTWFTNPVGAEIAAGDRVHPYSELDDRPREVVTFTES